MRRCLGKPEQQTPLKALLADFSMEVVAPPLLIREWAGSGWGHVCHHLTARLLSCLLYPFSLLYSFFSLPLAPSHSFCSSSYPSLPFTSSPSTALPLPSPFLSPPFPSPLFPFLSTANAPRVYTNYMNKMSRYAEPILQCVMAVGQTQLIRRQICRELGSSSKYDSKLLFNTLQAFNQ